jgi:hypothetical protein
MIATVLLNINICFGSDSLISSNVIINSTTNSKSTTSTTANSTVLMPSFYILLEVNLSLNVTTLNDDVLKYNYNKWVYD